MAKKVKVQSGHSRGAGFLSWKRLEKRLRQIGEITEQQKIIKVEIKKDGLYYNTAKRNPPE